jgi:ABC-type cobalamin/Fe3+-siderophores transport system ATPase subunit
MRHEAPNKIMLVVRNYRCFNDERPLVIPVSQAVIAFIGENNVGKTAALRLIAEFQNLWSVFPSALCNRCDTRVGIPSGFPLHVEHLDEIFCDENQRDLTLEFQISWQSDILTKVERVGRVKLTLERVSGQMYSEVQDTEGNIIHEITGVNQIALFAGNDRPLRCDGLFTIFQRFSHTRFIPNSRLSSDHTPLAATFLSGGEFVQNWNRWKNGTDKIFNRKAIELQSRLAQVFQFKSLEINAADNSGQLSLIVNGQPRRLREVGSGLAHFLFILGNIAMSGVNLTLIDEPEAGIHPRLQTQLLQILAEFSPGGLFLSTHSIALARVCADEIVTLRRRENGIECKELRSVTNIAEFLGEMSFAGYEALGFKKILFVEGQTDKPVAEALLAALFNCHDVLVLPLFGSTLISKNENAHEVMAGYTRISCSRFILLDSERSSADASVERKRTEFSIACVRLGYVVHILDRRATENYFNQRVISEAFGADATCLSPYQLLKDSVKPWSKKQNVKLAALTNADDIEGTDLFDFLKRVATD